jgi:ketosteroid isomerase-like protein
MAFDPVEEIARFHAAVDAIDFAAIEAYFAEHATYVSRGVGSLSGRCEIMEAFRKYFDDYPDQTSLSTLIEKVGPNAGRAVWSVRATHSKTGKPLVREGEETITFDEDGRVTHVEVTDYQAF